MQDAPRVLIVGQGRWGRRYAERFARRGALAGVVVRSEASARTLEARGSVPVSVGLDAALEAGGLDAVALMSPTDSHAALLERLLPTRLPTLVIKPATAQPAVARALFGRVNAAAMRVLVGHERLWSPPIAGALDLVADGGLGDVVSVTLVHRVPVERDDPSHRMTEVAGHNHAFLYEEVLHDATLLNRLAGRTTPAAVSIASCFASAEQLGLDATLEYARGPCARVVYETAEGLAFEDSTEIVGTQGRVVIVAGGAGGRCEWIGADGRTRGLPIRGSGHPVDALVDGFLEVVRGRRDVDETLEDGARAIEAGLAVARAAAAFVGDEVTDEALAGRDATFP